MNLHFDPAELSPLIPIQKAAILESLFLTIVIDRKIEPVELERLNAELHRIPLGLDQATVELIVNKARVRSNFSDSKIQWSAWIKEIASLLTTQSLREKLLGAMGQITLTTGDIDDHERGLLSMFAAEFGVSPERAAEIRAEVLKSKQ